MTEIQADYNFIMRCIDSSETSFQLEGCGHLIQFFEAKHREPEKAGCLAQMLKVKHNAIEGIFPPLAFGFAQTKVTIPDSAEVYVLQDDGVAVRENKNFSPIKNIS